MKKHNQTNVFENFGNALKQHQAKLKPLLENSKPEKKWYATALSILEYTSLETMNKTQLENEDELVTGMLNSLEEKDYQKLHTLMGLKLFTTYSGEFMSLMTQHRPQVDRLLKDLMLLVNQSSREMSELS